MKKLIVLTAILLGLSVLFIQKGQTVAECNSKACAPMPSPIVKS